MFCRSVMPATSCLPPAQHHSALRSAGYAQMGMLMCQWLGSWSNMDTDSSSEAGKLSQAVIGCTSCQHHLCIQLGHCPKPFPRAASLLPRLLLAVQVRHLPARLLMMRRHFCRHVVGVEGHASLQMFPSLLVSVACCTLLSAPQI